jgi:hypothetical protein
MIVGNALWLLKPVEVGIGMRRCVRCDSEGGSSGRSGRTECSRDGRRWKREALKDG